jgi:glycine/D-amino acid oxidase-like deaminating enzyme
MRVIVVGGGAMGLSVARALHRLGHAPVVLEQGTIPNPNASSADQHRLIRYAYGEAHGYAVMVRDAYAAWERLWSDLGQSLYVPSGQVLTAPRDDPWLLSSCRSLELMGIPHELLDSAAIAARFPMLDPERVECAFYSPTGGALLAERIVAALANWLRREGVEVRERVRVASLDPARGAVRLADGGELTGETVVAAAGPWLPRLVPALAGSIVPSRQVLIYVRPPAELAASWEGAPMITDVLTSGQSVFYAVPPVAGTGLKFGDHRFGRGGDPDQDREVPADEIDPILALASRRLRAVDRYEVTEARTCFYTVTDDERFVAHREDRVLALSPCSGHGFKFSALIGERVAQLLDEQTDFPSFASWLAGELPA